MQSSRQLPRFKGRASDFTFSGCQGTVKTQGTTLRIDSPKKPRNWVKPTPFDRYYRGRTRLSTATFMPSGGKSGSQAPKVLTYEKVDGGLPARYTRKLYGNLPRNRAYLLMQLRTGHNWLSTYAKKFGFLCECGAQETVAHVLMERPRLRELRVELRRKVGDALSGVSSLLGGSNEGEKGKPDIVSRAKTVQAVLDFAEASHRFRSHAP